MSELNKVQKKLLEMLEWFHAYCVENNITYYAAFGTMLGAVRHRGFIPWDDDLDVVVPRPDYEFLKKNFRDEGGKYRLEYPQMGNIDFAYPFVKIYDTTTTFVEDSQKRTRRGMYIDVFPLDGVGNSFEEARKKYRTVRPMMILHCSRNFTIRKDRGFVKNAVGVVAKALPFFNENRFCSKIDRTARGDYIHSKYVGMLVGQENFAKSVMEKRIYGKPCLYDFNGISVFGPEKAEEYLTKIFGDWKMLPPKEKRYSRHDWLDLNLNKSYLD